MSAELRIESENIKTGAIVDYSNLFIQNFGTGKKEGQFRGISGRILRGSTNADFLTLTDNPSRKVIFLLDSNGLNELSGLNGREALQNVGYGNTYIDGLIERGTRFKLAVLPEKAVQLATWDNLLKVVSKAYPEWKQRINESSNALKHLDFLAASTIGGTTTEVRKFLFETINVNELYRGDGTTPNGQKEYVAMNQPLSKFGKYSLIEFPVI